jgi:hypothetical protein
MQMPDSYVRADDNPELPCGEERTQALEQILSTGLTSFYWQAYRLLGNAADAEDAVRMLSLLPIPTWISSEVSGGYPGSDIPAVRFLCWQITIPIGISKT